jgi:hypothetical protein
MRHDWDNNDRRTRKAMREKTGAAQHKSSVARGSRPDAKPLRDDVMRQRRGRAILAATLAVAAWLTTPTRALAWGDEGHAIVALIAEHYLVPSARAKVAALLASDTDDLTPHDIANEAVWADRYRDSDRATTRQRYDRTWKWHFIDIELDRPDQTVACFGQKPERSAGPASLGPADDCVTDKIDAFARELAAKSTPPAERLLALKFLLHFVGDLHQPLHASDDHDAGGNQRPVVEDGEQPGNLHAYWDFVFVRQLGADPRTVADGLIAAISPDELRRWAAGGVADWAEESFALARDHVYAPLGAPDPTGVYRLDPILYGLNAEAITALQLSRAGVRLAAVLNRALALHPPLMPRAHL